jgi:hypothetical protein
MGRTLIKIVNEVIINDGVDRTNKLKIGLGFADSVNVFIQGDEL